MEKAFDIMVAGHLCIDIIPRFPDTGASSIAEIMRPGKLVNVEEAMISTGGPVSNTGRNMKVLGNRVCFCARVGGDELGKMTIAMLEKSGNAEGVRGVPGAASSYTVVVAPPGIDRIFLHNPGTNNTFGSDDLNPELIAGCRHFHFGYPPLMQRIYESDGEELRRVFQIARVAGATTSCDMALPDPDSPSGRVNWRAILEKILPFIDIYLPSLEETFFMLEPDEFLKMKRDHNDADLIDILTPEDYSRLADQVLSLGAKMVSLKSGHRGFYLKTASKEAFNSMGAARPGDPDNWSSRELWAPAFQVEKFGSATGSGDSSIAGLLTGFLRGHSIEQSLRYATCLGWQNVQVFDAVSGVRPWEETAAMAAEKHPLIEVKISSGDWKWSDEYEIWSGPGDPLSR